MFLIINWHLTKGLCSLWWSLWSNRHVLWTINCQREYSYDMAK